MDEKYPTKMEYFVNNKYVGKYLEAGCKEILIERAKTLKESITKKSQWKFSIPRKHPIILRSINGNRKASMSCIIEGNENHITRHNIELQVCSYDTNEDIFDFHIDLKDPEAKTPEPLYHMHVLGCEVPRFPFPPMDIILLCEFVLVNFFPTDSQILRDDPSWKNLVRNSQELFMKPYFEQCQKCLDNEKETLMGHLINLT